MLTGKRIAVYVTGGIAAYKSAYLVRLLQKKGALVRVVLTKSAQSFITSLTFGSLTKSSVYTDNSFVVTDGSIPHIELADWTELAIVVPATANIIAKMANGIADDFASTTLLATTSKIMVAPAMNTHMLHNMATQRNINQLKMDRVQFIEGEYGLLAEGYRGDGRMAEPSVIVAKIESYFSPQYQPLLGKNILVTAGGTRERIDPVRFLTNDSSGKMGYAIAHEAIKFGANVTLVSANVNQLTPPSNATFIPVQSAADMEKSVNENFDNQDIVVMAAAVSDYRPVEVADQKIKKSEQKLVLNLEKTPDILAGLGKQKTHQLLVGFAAETQDLLNYGQQKLIKKNADMIVANDVSNHTIGFNADENAVILIFKDGHHIPIAQASKNLVANQILKQVIKLLEQE